MGRSGSEWVGVGWSGSEWVRVGWSGWELVGVGCSENLNPWIGGGAEYTSFVFPGL